ncbi:hypothetical protein CDAR_548211 [Caerostris darwini]|uniref:Uncharacterized protein n=1 Tax=Caerostris darwini TaxID=1538125 RepID=A0AAV4WII8_9ARAC|nr:hypothetical protein CDAR_548211 [Caerostris darwini]
MIFQIPEEEERSHSFVKKYRHPLCPLFFMANQLAIMASRGICLIKFRQLSCQPIKRVLLRHPGPLRRVLEKSCQEKCFLKRSKDGKISI